MRTSNPEKVFNFLEEIFELTKDKPVRLSLSQIITRHKLSSAYYKALLETKILINLNNLQRGATYEWGSVRPPNMYMANMLMHKVSEHNKEYNLSKKTQNQTPEPVDPKTEYRIVQNGTISTKIIEEVKPLIDQISIDKTERKCLYDGNLFIPRLSTQKFCSDNCRTTYNNYQQRQRKLNEQPLNQQPTNNQPTINQPIEVQETPPVKKEFSFCWGLVKFKW